MRKSCLCSVFCFAFTLTACTTLAPPAHSKTSAMKQGEARVAYATSKHRAKPGNEIAFYPKETSIKRPYRVIGKETVSRYNFIGMERQSKTLDGLMRNLAGLMGGDAVMNISVDLQKVEGTVISFEKVLL